MKRMTAPIKAGGLPELQRLGQAVMPRRLFQVAIGLSQLQLGLLLAAMKLERKQLLPPLQARNHPAYSMIDTHIFMVHTTSLQKCMSM